MFINYKFIIITLLIMFFSCFGFNSYAQESDAKFIESVENQLFSIQYNNDDIEKRITRIEEVIFGMASDDQSKELRIQRLKEILSMDTEPEVIDLKDPNSVPSQAQEIKPESIQSETPTSTENSYQSPYVYVDDVEVEDYPALSYLENKVFNKTYKGEDILKRLDRLEQNLFNNTYSQSSLSERLDKIKVAVVGSSNLPRPNKMNEDSNLLQRNNYQNQTFYQEQTLNPQPYQQSPQSMTFQNEDGSLGYTQQYFDPSSQNNTMPEESLKQITSRLEEELLGQNYQSEPTNIRIDRLEMHVFNKTSQEKTPQARLERLVAVVAAENTSDPTDLKKIKRLRKIQTGLTVGGILFTILQGLLF